MITQNLVFCKFILSKLVLKMHQSSHRRYKAVATAFALYPVWFGGWFFI